MRTELLARAILATVLALSSAPSKSQNVVQGETLNRIVDRGVVACGVGNNDVGFAQRSLDGTWRGFDVDFCRSVAAAVLGDSEAVDYVPLDSLNRLDALESGIVDLLLRTTTWTFSRDTSMGLDFAGVVLFDTQGILVHEESGITKSSELAGKTICTNRGTTSVDNLKDFIKESKITAEVLELESQDGRWRAFFNRECEAISADKTDLLAKISTLDNGSAKYHILDEDLSNEPLGVAVRDQDRQWFDIVKWVVMALIAAEEAEMTSVNALSFDGKLSDLSSIKLGLESDWVVKVISQVGNYGEIFERNLGMKSNIKLKRGRNGLTSQGGLHYAMPMR